LGLGYPNYLAKRFEQSQYTVGFENLGIPGARSETVIDQLKLENVQTSIKKAEFITIDIGGNDLLAVVRPALENPTVPINPAMIQKEILNTAIEINTILKTIEALNPKAKVYVMGYFNVLPYLPEDVQKSLLPVLDAFNRAIESTALANVDTFVPTAKIIAKDYPTYLPNKENIHLSLEGYQAVAKEFWKYIDKSKNKH
jgi:lysophospholipase L1-like esterase